MEGGKREAMKEKVENSAKDLRKQQTMKGDANKETVKVKRY